MSKDEAVILSLILSCCRRKCQDGPDAGPAQQIPGAERETGSSAVLLAAERQTALQRKPSTWNNINVVISGWRKLCVRYSSDVLFPQLDIVQQEYIHESGLQQFEVVKAAFDASGSWLATVEERKQKAAELELNLKLWAFDEQAQR